MKKKELKLNKVRISKINNLNTILGGVTQNTLEATRHESCEYRETCIYSQCAATTTGTDTTDGEVTGKPMGI